MEDQRRILLIEDNPDHRIQIAERLKEHGLAVETSRDGAQGLVKLARAPYDLLLLDYNLPKENGLTILREMRSQDIKLPVIFLTGLGSEEIAVEAMKVGASDYIVKRPDLTHLDKLVHAISNALERQRLEAELATIEARYGSLFEQALDAIFVLSPQGIITDINPAGLRLFGAQRQDEMMERPLGEFIHTEEDRRKLQRLLKRGKPIQGWQMILQRSDGITFPALLTAGLLRDDRQVVLGYEGIIRDITEDIKREEHHIKMEKMRALGELSGGIAHDFNNLLGIILGRAQLLKMQLEDEKARSMLEIIEQAALDGAATVDQIQEFTRGGPIDTASPVDLTQIVEDAFALTKTKWKDEAEAEGKEIQLQVDAKKPLSVVGNASQLREVVTNLLFNAVDAIEERGTITIALEEEGQEVVLRVHDTGVGMDKRICQQVFEPYFTTKGLKGTGLGLSVAYGIVQRHGGQISARSKPGKGSVFTVRLPRSSRKTKIIAPTPTPPTSRPARILMIDDEIRFTEPLKEILQQEGHTVTLVDSAHIGMEVVAKTPQAFDIVFTDLSMPEISGWEVIQRIRALNDKVVLVLMTGWDAELGEAELKKRGADLCLGKPVHVNDLLETLSLALDIRSARQPHQPS